MLRGERDELARRVRALEATSPERAEEEMVALRIARDVAREEAAALAGSAAAAREAQARLDAVTREKDAELAGLRQHAARLEPFAMSYREAERRAEAAERDRDAQVAALRRRIDALEAAAHRGESERVRKAGA